MLAFVCLAVVVNGASTLPSAVQLPSLIVPFTYLPPGDGQVAAALIDAAGLVAGLVLIWVRAWPAALLLGPLVTLPEAVALATAHPMLAVGWPAFLARLGSPLVLMAVLGAAQHVAQRKWLGLGAALAGAVVGAGLLGASLVGAAGLLHPPVVTAVHLWLSLSATAAGAVAVLRLGRPPAPPPGPLTMLTALLAVAVGLASALATEQNLSQVFGVPLATLHRHLPLLRVLLGIAVLCASGVLALLNGPRATAAAVASALVQASIATGLILAMFTLAFAPLRGVEFAVLGLVAGCALAALPGRALIAAAGNTLLVVVLLTGVPVLLSGPQMVQSLHGHLLVAGLLLAALIALAVISVGAAAAALGPRAELSTMVGPIAGALAAGLTLTTFSNGAPPSNYLTDNVSTSGSIAALALAATLLVALFLARPRRPPWLA